jgi:hypothetical protein
MNLFKTSLIAATLAIGTHAGLANADDVVNGTFNISIYNYNPPSAIEGGSGDGFNTLTRRGQSAATLENVTNYGGVAEGSYTFVGNLDFTTAPLGSGTVSKIWQFLASSGGTLDGLAINATNFSELNIDMSTGSFLTTTLFVFTGDLGGPATGTIDHDDGVRLYDSGNVVRTALSAAAPTVEVETSFALPDNGQFTLVYSAANANPEVLRMEATVVPLPAAAWLFGSALVGMGFIGRRKIKA